VRTIPGDNRLFTRRIVVLAGVLAVLNQRPHRVLIHTWNPVIVERTRYPDAMILSLSSPRASLSLYYMEQTFAVKRVLGSGGLNNCTCQCRWWGASMAQVTIYLDDAAEKRVKAAAKKAGVSVGQWVAELVKNRTRTEWPPEVLELAGAWPDFPDPEDIRPVGGKDSRRARL
jgi:hypothetical protein